MFATKIELSAGQTDLKPRLTQPPKISPILVILVHSTERITLIRPSLFWKEAFMSIWHPIN
jgi:hypothetical protein